MKYNKLEDIIPQKQKAKMNKVAEEKKSQDQEVINQQALAMGKKDEEITKLKEQINQGNDVLKQSQGTIKYLLDKIKTITDVAAMAKNEINNAMNQ